MRPLSVVVLAGLAVLAIGCSQDLCPGVAVCGGTCADLATSTLNCGACGRACSQEQACVAGACVALGCTDECPAAGVIGCAAPPQDGIVVCAEFADGDPCLEWGGFRPCAAGQTCRDGACVGGCQDECQPEGLRECEGTGYRECGRQDGGSCLAWGDVVPCGAGQSCSSGACSSACVDECDEDQRKCDGDGFRTCGQFDGDDCREWSPIQSCGAGASCSGGRCQSTQCLEEGEDCVCGEDQCCEGHCCPVFFICISSKPDGDFCPFGPGPNG